MNDEYQKGYAQALQDINTPMLVIQEDWNPSQCPRCKTRYFEEEDCDDGYYQRAYALKRCPYCGQRLEWYADE